jgi:hypothetical protein
MMAYVLRNVQEKIKTRLGQNDFLKVLKEVCQNEKKMSFFWLELGKGVIMSFYVTHRDCNA